MKISTITYFGLVSTATCEITCGLSSGYDKGEKAYYYSGDGSLATFDTCSARCQSDTKCQSFAFGSSQCLLYASPLDSNFREQSNSPFLFYDRNCVDVKATSSFTTILPPTTAAAAGGDATPSPASTATPTPGNGGSGGGNGGGSGSGSSESENRFLWLRNCDRDRDRRVGFIGLVSYRYSGFGIWIGFRVGIGIRLWLLNGFIIIRGILIIWVDIIKCCGRSGRYLRHGGAGSRSLQRGDHLMERPLMQKCNGRRKSDSVASDVLDKPYTHLRPGLDCSSEWLLQNDKPSYKDCDIG
ncbi:hypothetical protein J7T55_015409 [Diaporthe amygdali]|uniref:uncharacterized protein n=1 Tax=Phomopsis amygdali TaxID=1214568 RepID=UPI0022FDCB60|nr:uncharacterized protein J7T55_015409 [Diaporthe amygdali]KAJ0120678.1 hypothetical protein J7T55_015409 [Diaporthe amygdali]